jgi:hypothetical protein
MQSTDPLRIFYKTLEGEGERPLEPDDPYYVNILGGTPEKDPVRRLWQRIQLASSESVSLLTGFRGNGKSTELRRLKKLLEESGCTVFFGQHDGLPADDQAGGAVRLHPLPDGRSESCGRRGG